MQLLKTTAIKQKNFQIFKISENLLPLSLFPFLRKLLEEYSSEMGKLSRKRKAQDLGNKDSKIRTSKGKSQMIGSRSLESH